ncbi:MAG: hypothetical protein WKF60_11695, partial [Ilumatobacter sp.]
MHRADRGHLPDCRSRHGGPVGIEFTQEIVDDLGSANELRRVPDIMEIGNGVERQRRAVEQGGTLLDVVHVIAWQPIDDRLTG